MLETAVPEPDQAPLPVSPFRLGSDPSPASPDAGQARPDPFAFRMGSDANAHAAVAPFGLGSTPTTAETTPAVIALKAAVEASKAELKTVEEATIAAPKLEDLFAALESAPVRLATSEPKPAPPQEPVPEPAFVPPAPQQSWLQEPENRPRHAAHDPDAARRRSGSSRGRCRQRRVRGSAG